VFDNFTPFIFACFQAQVYDTIGLSLEVNIMFSSDRSVRKYSTSVFTMKGALKALSLLEKNDVRGKRKNQ
jgi:hypothetical protein